MFINYPKLKNKVAGMEEKLQGKCHRNLENKGYFQDYDTVFCRRQLNSAFKDEQDLDTYKWRRGTSLMVQWLRPQASNARGIGLIPGKETKMPDAVWCCQTNKQKMEKRG